MIKELYTLVHSLSSIEKKMFTLNSRISETEKDYLELYKIILDHSSGNILEIQKTFQKRFPKKSFQNNISYLFKSIIKTLVVLRVGQDKWFNELYGLMIARLCIERAMPNYALKTLAETKKNAKVNQNQIITYYSERMEMSLLSDLNFPDINETTLVERQMNLKTSLNKIKHVQEQLSLLELLRLRILSQDLLSNEINQKKTQDLVLSEMALVSRRNKEFFASQKLHLMFQSFILAHISDYNSALKIFYDLSNLFEINEYLWSNPPYDYLSVLEEILNTLSTISRFYEMEFFINQLSRLIKKGYPEHFSTEANKTLIVYTLNYLVGLGRYNEALIKVRELNPKYNLNINTRKDSEFLLWTTILYCYLENWTMVKKISSSFLIHLHEKNIERVGRLLFIISSYELQDTETLEYEIRSYKRKFRKSPILFDIEKSIFSLIGSNVLRRGNAYNAKLKSKIEDNILSETSKINEAHKYLLKYYDFHVWIRKHL